jgi:hypothetical protein
LRRERQEDDAARPGRPDAGERRGSVAGACRPDEAGGAGRLDPETHEFLLLHVHAHLDVFVNGTPVTVPAGIGIEIHDPGVHSAVQEGSTVYGFIDPPCAQPCISPLHTHDVSGILHTEAKKNQFNNLGEFFTEWNVRLDDKCVGGYCKPAAPISIYVDGDAYTGNPRQIGLENLREIAIVIGTPPTTIPSTFPR